MAGDDPETEKNAPPAILNSNDSEISDTSNSIWERIKERIVKSKVCWVISWTPPNCRWDPESPAEFSFGLNVLFAFAGAFTVANLYYNHPILNILAHDFHVTYEEVSAIPTLMQAGYAVGLLLLCPLGDLFPRRPFVILLVLITATLWVGLCITNNLRTFEALSFITAVTTVTPQLMLPLVGELAPPNKRAAALGIVTSGLTIGILVARVLSGTVTNYVSWRYIYWMSAGLQYLIALLLWLFMPAYPSTNPGGLNYFYILYTVFRMLTKHGVLVQACLIAFCTAGTFTSFWTTLTFLLSSPPYNYKPLPIGLFGLIGIFGTLFIPIFSRNVTDRYVPILSIIVGELMNLVAITIGTYTGTFTVAGPVIQAFLLDAGMQTVAVANRSAIYAIEPKARNRVNTAFMLATFCGQLTGTSVGNKLYAEGGWIRSGSCSVGFICGTFLLVAMRGPWEDGWVGWHGGWSMKKKDKNSADGKTAETAAYSVQRRQEAIRQGDLESGEREETAMEKVLEEMAADEGHESPLHEDRDIEKSIRKKETKTSEKHESDIEDGSVKERAL